MYILITVDIISQKSRFTENSTTVIHNLSPFIVYKYQTVGYFFFSVSYCCKTDLGFWDKMSNFKIDNLTNKS